MPPRKGFSTPFSPCGCSLYSLLCASCAAADVHEHLTGDFFSYLLGEFCCAATCGLCGMLYFMLSYRMPDREALAIKYRVHDDDNNTCCLHCFCGPCLLAQELRHIADVAAAGYPGGPSFSASTSNPIVSSARSGAAYVAPAAFAVIESVTARSPADAAGLREGDRVVSVCGAKSFGELGACIETAAQSPQHVGNVTKVLRGSRALVIYVKPALGSAWAGRLGATLVEVAVEANDKSCESGGSGAAK
jgi:Cys-rich protein (TIGR01571 family)